MKKILILVVILCLASCTSSPSKATREKLIAESNIAPYPINYEELVKEYFKKNLKDPDSAKYEEICRPTKEYSYVTKSVVWQVYASVNAKNSYGGYTGTKTSVLTLGSNGVTDSFQLAYFMPCGGFK